MPHQMVCNICHRTDNWLSTGHGQWPDWINDQYELFLFAEMSKQLAKYKFDSHFALATWVFNGRQEARGNTNINVECSHTDILY